MGQPRKKRRWLRRLALVTFLLVLGVYVSRDAIFFTFLYRGTRADWAVEQLRWERESVRHQIDAVKHSGKSADELRAALEPLAATELSLRERALRLATDNPGTRAELGALLFVAEGWPQTAEGTQAQQSFVKRAAKADMAILARLFQSMHLRQAPRWLPFADLLVRRVRENPDDPGAAIVLVEAAIITASDTDVPQTSAAFREIADLVVDRFAASPDIANFCTQFGHGEYSPAWSRPYEPHLRKILAVNQDRFVRASAKMALASIARDSGAERQPEAAALFEEFLAEFDGKVKHPASGIEEMFRETAKRQLAAIRDLGLGRPAPTVPGVDLEGNRLALSDYRGKVVLVSFWASWCGPCLKLVPHEKELVSKFAPADFAMVGANVDSDLDAARAVAARLKMPWPSFRNTVAGAPDVADQWRVEGYPTVYLVDQQGAIRHRWFGNAHPEALEIAIRQLIDGASVTARGAAAEGVHRAVRAPAVTNKEYAPIDVIADGPEARGFVGKIFRPSTGDESRYVVFIPHQYDGTPTPAILFLHGSGLIGRDGRGQLRGALANAIHERSGDFPFIALFPQSQAGSWQAGTPDGRRALAILDEVATEHVIDPARVYLTGCSMGGEGTWSLAAAFPERWAAIVPLCGGGDPATAVKFKDIPCWCFHGDADRMIPPQLSREMVSAIRKAGGRPLYQEYPGVDHNCWDETYANPELFDWLLQQRRTLRE